jgi:hypothetical protein
LPIQALQAAKDFIYNGRVLIQDKELVNFTNAARFLQLRGVPEAVAALRQRVGILFLCSAWQDV